ncbi:MAG: c-type cytochrome domain-containing protein [Verrucomicrobiota bacterium]
MKRGILPFLALTLPATAALPEKVTYDDHILPLFQNACLNCHNPDKKKAGLDLSTYAATLAGSDNGKIMHSGDAAGSLLYKCVKGTEEPTMPPKGDRLNSDELALIEKWIAGRAPESLSSKGAPVANAVANAVVSLERPAGAPPMPGTYTQSVPIAKVPRTNSIVALAASPWAPLTAVGGHKQVILFHSDTLETLGVLPFPEGLPTTLHFSRNGQILLVGGGIAAKSGKVALWKVETGERIATIGNEVDQVLAADLSPNQSTVVLGGPNRVLKFYNTKDGALVRSIKKHTDWVTAVSFSPDGAYVASADRAGGITVWEAASGAESVTLPGHKTAVNGLAFLPGILASAGQDGTVVLWDVAEGKERKKWNAHAGGCESVDFTSDGRIVTCGRDKVAKVWDQSGKLLLTTQPLGEIALRAVIAGDSIIAGDWNGKVQAFALADGGKPLGDLLTTPVEGTPPR